MRGEGIHMIPKRPAAVPSDAAAAYVLQRLMQDGRITLADIAHYITDLPKQIARIEARLQVLREHVPPIPSRQRPKTPASHHGTRPKRDKAATAKSLGGMYGGLIRRLPAAEQATYAAIKESRGIAAAIAALKERSASSEK